MRKLAIKLIKSYQKNHTTPRCKYSPTCSNYALEAYSKFNFFKASILSGWRILRCNPFSKGGYDPVPLSKAEKLKDKSE
ncbi:MAG: membrane protein insertion efficiency factor YidD [Bacilli bacterium]